MKKILLELGKYILIAMLLVIGSNGIIYILKHTPAWVYFGSFILLLVTLLMGLIHPFIGRRREIFLEKESRELVENVKSQKSRRKKRYEKKEIIFHFRLNYIESSRPGIGIILIAVTFFILILTIIFLNFFYLNRFPVYWAFILKYNFWISFILVIFLLQLTLRKSILKTQTWDGIINTWLKFSGIPALAVGGFGIISENTELKNKVIKITTDSTYVDMKLLGIIYTIVILFIGLTYLLSLIGITSSNDRNSNKPPHIFIPAFIIVWIANLGIYTLLFDSILLTLHAHLSL